MNIIKASLVTGGPQSFVLCAIALEVIALNAVPVA